jgi:hypothetical protein
MGSIHRRNLVPEGLQGIGPESIEPAPQFTEAMGIDVVQTPRSLGSMCDEPGGLEHLQVL